MHQASSYCSRQADRLACRPIDEAPIGTCASCHREFGGRLALIEVADNGPGIPVRAQDKIFDPFFTTKDVGKGSGLGLPMVHGITHASGGHILVNSSAAGGTRFQILLPLASSAP